MTGKASRPVSGPKVIVLGGLLLALIFGGCAWWLWPAEFNLGGDTSIEGMVAQIRSWGHWAALGSIVLMIVHSFLPFPSEIITLANGMVFGPFLGTVVTWVGAMLGAVITFGLVRQLGRPFVHRMLSEHQLRRLEDWSSASGGVTLLTARLIPLIAFNLLNYAAALTEISWWTFLWATGLGILPLTILLNVFGASILTVAYSLWIWLPLAVIAALGWILARRYSKSRGDG